MKLFEIEAWALRIIDRIRLGQPIEDSRVEIKSEWPEYRKAARLIAGHANASGGEPILWLIGVDQQRGIRGADNLELANWYPQVVSQFDGQAPAMTNINNPSCDLASQS